MFIRLAKVSLTIVSCIIASSSNCRAQSHKSYIVNGYVGGFRGLVDAEAIKADKLTHINYAFVNVKDSLAVLTNLKTDSINFRNLNALKLINPELKILISIGGWTWSGNFSDAVLTPSSRKLFAKSSVDIVREYKLDGVDIDWEYPGMRGYEGNVFRPEDKENFTLMFKEIRLELDKLSQETGKKYQLTTAVGGSKSFIDNTEMGEVAKIVDYVYVMTYDFGGHKGKIGHHTNLYPTSIEVDGSSADGSIRNFIAAGVPAHKLVLGIGFYGKAWVAESIENNGLGEASIHSSQNQGLAKDQGGGYTKIKDTMIGKNGYKRYWDKKAKAPYLFNKETKVFVTYEDEKSVKEKVKYVKKNNLSGIFFWEYFEDPKEYLLNAIDKTLH
jgi:chitinase